MTGPMVFGIYLAKCSARMVVWANESGLRLQCGSRPESSNAIVTVLGGSVRERMNRPIDCSYSSEFRQMKNHQDPLNPPRRTGFVQKMEVWNGMLWTWEIAEQGKSPKVVRGGCKRSFWLFCAQGTKVSQESFAPPKASFAPVQPHVAPVQEASCSRGPKDLLHPLLTTFGNFHFSGNFQVRSFPRFGVQTLHLWHEAPKLHRTG